ncbi:SDR family oxidoreductase [Nitrospirales bacterium NOB]|nr:SDR family oxidoreductase [Nitrospirales bacterium NOB]
MTTSHPRHELFVVVSGSEGGVGSAILQYFHGHAARIIGIDRKPMTKPPASPTVEHIFQADLSRHEEVVAVGKAIGDLWSRVDILVNAAGTFLTDMQVWAQCDQWNQLWNDNVTSAVLLSQEMYPLLRRGRQSLVVNVASTDAIVASAGQSCEIGVAHDILYATTKGALVTLTRALAMAWARDDIRVNAICPTIIPSPMTRELLAVPTKRDELTSFIPLRSLCSPEDVAVAVHALYQLKMTTGHILPLDGGYLCM